MSDDARVAADALRDVMALQRILVRKKTEDLVRSKQRTVFVLPKDAKVEVDEKGEAEIHPQPPTPQPR